CVDAGEAPSELADRRSGGGQDHGLGHGIPFPGSGWRPPMLVTCRRVKVEATTDSPLATAADTIVVGLFGDEGVAHDVSGGALGALLESGEARSDFRSLAVAHAEGRRFVLVG